MAGRRVTWRRLVVVHANPLLNDENLSLRWERDGEGIQDRLRNPLRPQPRIPLRDITHLYPGNVMADDKIEDQILLVHQGTENGRLRRRAAPVQQNSKKRRLAQCNSELSSGRSALRKTFR